MENIIVEEGGSVERLLSSEVFMAQMILCKEQRLSLCDIMHVVDLQVIQFSSKGAWKFYEAEYGQATLSYHSWMSRGYLTV